MKGLREDVGNEKNYSLGKRMFTFSFLFMWIRAIWSLRTRTRKL